MDIRTQLSEQEKAFMVEYIRTYAFASSERRKNIAPIDTILEQWSFNKENLYNLFKGNLILSKEISIRAPKMLINSELDQLWSTQLFCAQLRDAVEADETFGNWTYSTEEKACRGQDMSPLEALWELTKNDYISQNLYARSTFKVVFANGKELKVENGCKVMRVMGRIVNMLAETSNMDWRESFESYRLEHSRILNTATLEGTLCLSIHPLDFMTMSDNDEGWTSCMSWRGWGCYRQGTVEMMNSNNVIVAYLTHKDYKPIEDNEDFWWNSKSWRSLYVVTDDLIASVKGYPYCSSDLDKIVLDWVRELKGGLWTLATPYYEAYRDVDNHGYVEIRTDDCSRRVRMWSGVMYNDFGLAEKAYITFSEFAPKEIEITYSGPAMCVACGEIAEDFESGSLVCGGHCTASRYCSCCNQWFYDDEMSQLWDYCQTCYNNNTMIDQITNETFYNDNKWKNRIWLVPEEAVERLKIANSVRWQELLQIYNCRYITVDIHRNLYTKELHAYMSSPYVVNIATYREFCRPRYFITDSMLTLAGRELFNTASHPYPID